MRLRLLGRKIGAIRVQLKRLADDQANLWSELSQRAIEH